MNQCPLQEVQEGQERHWALCVCVGGLGERDSSDGRVSGVGGLGPTRGIDLQGRAGSVHVSTELATHTAHSGLCALCPLWPRPAPPSLALTLTAWLYSACCCREHPHRPPTSAPRAPSCFSSFSDQEVPASPRFSSFQNNPCTWEFPVLTGAAPGTLLSTRPALGKPPQPCPEGKASRCDRAQFFPPQQLLPPVGSADPGPAGPWLQATWSGGARGTAAKSLLRSVSVATCSLPGSSPLPGSYLQASEWKCALRPAPRHSPPGRPGEKGLILTWSQHQISLHCPRPTIFR